MLGTQQTECSKPAFTEFDPTIAPFPGDRAIMHVISARMETCGSLPLGAGLWPSRFLSREERHALEDSVVSSQTIGAHSDLISEGARAHILFLIKDGWACRYTMTRDGRRQFLALLVPGDLCNLDSLLSDRLDYGVRTLTQATIVVLPRDRVVALATEHPGIARMFAWRALVENAILDQSALALGRRSAKERLAHLLCELSVRLGMRDDEESSFEFPLTQEQIADALGLTVVHVNRMMAVLHAEGLITRANRRLTIQNVARLRHIGGFDPSYLHIGQDEIASENQLLSHRSSSLREARPSELGACWQATGLRSHPALASRHTATTCCSVKLITGAATIFSSSSACCSESTRE